MDARAAIPQTPRRKVVPFNSWKEIAAYFDRGVRTVQRWHSELHMPVHKVRATPRSPVFAYKAELDLWMQQNALRERSEYPYSIALERVHLSSSAEKAVTSLAKMASLIGKQRDQLNRLAEEVHSLAQVQNISQRKLR